MFSPDETQIGFRKFLVEITGKRYHNSPEYEVLSSDGAILSSGGADDWDFIDAIVEYCSDSELPVEAIREIRIIILDVNN